MWAPTAPRYGWETRAVDDAVVVDRAGGRPHVSGAATDILVYGMILALGVLEIGLSRRSDDFVSGDVTYFELARSIIETGFYGYAFRPETMIPPGFPALEALLCITVGCTYTVLIRSMAVFATLGLLVSYVLLRREQGRAVAAVSCLLLGSSPILFAFSTRTVFSDLPYFFTSMATLLLATRLDTAKRLRGRGVVWLLCGLLLVESMLIRSAGIALLTGLTGWLAASWFADREIASRRLKTFLPLLLVGLVVQALWMQWVAKHEVLEWPLVGGYPHSYIAQLRVKSGNRPELGSASLSDIPSRVAKNLDDRAVGLMELLTRRWINPTWLSPLVVGPVLLILMGVGCSMWRGAGSLPAWYFVSHEAIYLVWPWDFEARFFLPVAPLACLYLWRGGGILLGAASRTPQAVGAWSVVPVALLGVSAGAAAWSSGSVQIALAAVFWALLAMMSAWMAWSDLHRLPTPLGWLLSQSRVIVPGRGKSLRLATVIAAVIVAVLGSVGVAGQLTAGRENLTFDVTRATSYPDIEAGQWIRAHTADTAVVMARQLDVVYHYGRRRVVWFPPLSNPQELMDGIRRHGVEFVVVSSRKYTYWFPPEQDCFESLLRVYPRVFRPVHEGPRMRIFQVAPELRGDAIGRSAVNA